MGGRREREGDRGPIAGKVGVYGGRSAIHVRK